MIKTQQAFIFKLLHKITTITDVQWFLVVGTVPPDTSFPRGSTWCVQRLIDDIKIGFTHHKRGSYRWFPPSSSILSFRISEPTHLGKVGTVIRTRWKDTMRIDVRSLFITQIRLTWAIVSPRFFAISSILIQSKFPFSVKKINSPLRIRSLTGGLFLDLLHYRILGSNYRK